MTLMTRAFIPVQIKGLPPPPPFGAKIFKILLNFKKSPPPKLQCLDLNCLDILHRRIYTIKVVQI